MLVRISDERLLPDLLEYLGARMDAIVTQTAPDALEANVLGYGIEGASMELDVRLEAWQSAHPGVVVEHVRARLSMAESAEDDE